MSTAVRTDARFGFGTMTPGMTTVGTVCVRRLEHRTTKKGDPFIVANLINNEGSADTKVWKESVPAWDGVAPGDGLWIRARVVEGYQGGPPELDILELDRLPQDHPIRLEVNPVCPVPLEELERRLDALIDLIERPSARRLVEVGLAAVGRDNFLNAPAARGHHHNYIHGLVEHACEVAAGALRLCQLPPYRDVVDYSAVVAGGLLHDIGKTREYVWDQPIDISEHGRLRSHVSYGSELLTRAVTEAGGCEKLGILPKDLLHAQHVIESHHGVAEWGSPTAPASIEALAVHVSDLFSARGRPMVASYRDADPDASWTGGSGWKARPIWRFATDIDRSEIFGGELPRLHDDLRRLTTPGGTPVLAFRGGADA